ncbi:unnamed protein product, partial [Urochloa humidicola]
SGTLPPSPSFRPQSSSAPPPSPSPRPRPKPRQLAHPPALPFLRSIARDLISFSSPCAPFHFPQGTGCPRSRTPPQPPAASSSSVRLQVRPRSGRTVVARRQGWPGRRKPRTSPSSPGIGAAVSAREQWRRTTPGPISFSRSGVVASRSGSEQGRAGDGDIPFLHVRRRGGDEAFAGRRQAGEAGPKFTAGHARAAPPTAARPTTAISMPTVVTTVAIPR